MKEPYCPVDAPTRAWLDYRWAWLCHQFGTRGIKQRPVILPTPEFFPDAYEGKPEHVEALVHRVAGYMDVDPATLEVHYYEETHNPVMSSQQGTAGMYLQNAEGKFEIWLEVTNLHDPERMIATIAHELAHVLLLGQGRITTQANDHEPLTDLLTVFYGLGAFPANTALHENYWHEAHYAGWTIGRLGYLSMNMFGYAHALLARSQEGTDPKWLKHLRLDVRKACEQSIKYLADHPDQHTDLGKPVDFPLVKKIETPAHEQEVKEEENETEFSCTYCAASLAASDVNDDETNSGYSVCFACRNSMEEADNYVVTPEEIKRRASTFDRFIMWFFLAFLALALLSYFSSRAVR